jgi:signal transduction histidine kinase
MGAHVRRVGAVAVDALAAALWSREPTTPVYPGGLPGGLLLLVHAAFQAWAAVPLLAVGLEAPDAPTPQWAAVVAAHLAGVALGCWRPLLGWRLVVAALVAGALLLPGTELVMPRTGDLLWAGPALAALLVLVGLSRPAPAAVVAGLVTAAVLVAAGAGPAATVWTVLPLVVALALASRNRARGALAAEQRTAAEARTERAVLAERARIAREMHDTIAHHMSLIAVRCETAPYRLGDLPGPARAELAQVGSAARAALGEMQAMLGVLRTGDGPAERAPQPGLGDLPGLLAQAREAGATVRATLDADLDDVPDGPGLAAFRVVQQALSNAGQHARGAPVAVTVERRDEELRIAVANGGGGAAGAPGGGLGLAGLRERVEVLGGAFTAGPAPGGGFEVRAAIPLPAGPPGPAPGPAPGSAPGSAP